MIVFWNTIVKLDIIFESLLFMLSQMGGAGATLATVLLCVGYVQ